MRYLSLDVGNKRVGVAVGSQESGMATPLAVYLRGVLEQDAALVRALATEYDADALVVGLPLNTNPTPNDQAALTRAYLASLEPLVGLPIVWHDERFSTAAARDAQRARGLNDKRGKATLDASAAAVILQDYLDSLTSSTLPSSRSAEQE